MDIIVAISLIIALGAAIGVVITAYYDRKKSIEDDPLSTDSRVTSLESDVGAVKLSLVRIETDITWLKSSQIEILREIRNGKEKK